MAISKSSFNFQKADLERAEEHNKRKSKITYLLKHLNSDVVNENKNYMNYDEFKNLAMSSYKKTHNQTMQKKQIDNLFLEAVINITKEHTTNDIENLFKNLKKEFSGFELLDISIHRDEGVFIDSPFPEEELVYDSKNLNWYHNGENVTDEIIDFKPSTDIFYNENTKKWYLDKDFKVEADMKKLQLKMNYHAHAIFSLYDRDTCKSARLNKTQMSQLQTVVANLLNMERGKIWSKTQRKNHWQIKEEHSKLREKKLEKKANENDLKLIIKNQREELKKLGGKREEHSILEQLHRDLKIKLKNENLTIGEIEDLVSNASYFKTEYEKLKIEIEKIIGENQELKESLKNVEDENLIFKNVIKSLEHDIDNLRNKSAMYLNLNQDLNKEIKKVKFTVQSLYTELEKKEESNINLKSENINLNREIEELNSIHEDTKSDLNDVLEENLIYKKQIKKHEIEIEDLRAKNTIFLNQNKQLNLQIKLLKEELEIATEFDDFNEEIEEIKLEPIPDTSHLRKEDKKRGNLNKNN